MPPSPRRGGDIQQASTAAGSIVAYLATLDGAQPQLEALDKLQEELVNRLERRGISGEAEDRHFAVDDAIEQARSTLSGPPKELRSVADKLADSLKGGQT